MTLPRLLAAASVVPLLVVAVPSSAPAVAAPSSVTLTYACQMARESLERLPTPTELEVTLTLDTPRSAAPGSTLRPTGTMSVTPSTTSRALFGLLAQRVHLEATSFTPEAVADGVGTLLPTDWTSGVEATSDDPLVLTGPVELPAYVVPERARSVELRLPSRNLAGATIGTVPVSINLEAVVTDLLGIDTSYYFSCAAPDDADATAARVGVAADAPEPTPTPDLPAPAPVGAPALGGGSLPGTVAPPVAEPAPAPATVVVTETAAPAPLALISAAQWGVPPAAGDGDALALSPTRLATWTVVLVALALGWAAWSQQRLRRLRAANA